MPPLLSMKFLIAFEKSGDTLVFDAISSETYAILEYYVNQLELNNTNKFSSHKFQAKDAIESFNYCLKTVNKFIKAIIEEDIPIGDYRYYLDQQVLNKIHANWVKSQSMDYVIAEKRTSKNTEIRYIADRLHELFSDDIEVIKFRDALEKLGLTDAYSKVNVELHRLEQQFNKLRFKTNNWIEFNNPFDKSLLTNNISNFRLSFNHLGRTLYNKWKYFDTDLLFDDENSFDQLLGYVDINLCRSETVKLSPEYVSWCQGHGKTPSGDFLNIGNITDLDKKLNECRIVLYRNILDNNSFSIKLNKG